MGHKSDEQVFSQDLASGIPCLGTRIAENDDAQLLLQIYASARAEEMALLENWNEKQRESFLKMQLLAQKTDYDRRYPASDHRIILLGDRPVGQLWICRSETEIRLLDIALLRDYRRQGIGTILLRGLQKEAAEHGKILRHCVHKDNSGALAFYRKLQFAVCGDLGMHFLMEWKP